jgi:hypothetical protein
MKLKQIVVAVAAAMLSAGAFAGGGEHAKQQPRAESGNGSVTQSQSGQQQGQQQAQGGQQKAQAQAQSPELVKQAQQALKDKGIEAGPVDGQLGPLTQQGLKQYQEQQNIQASGQLDQQTLASLGIGQSASAGSSSAEPSASSGSSSRGSSSSKPEAGMSSSGSSAPPSATAEPQKGSAGASGGGVPASPKD